MSPSNVWRLGFKSVMAFVTKAAIPAGRLCPAIFVNSPATYKAPPAETKLFTVPSGAGSNEVMSLGVT